MNTSTLDHQAFDSAGPMDCAVEPSFPLHNRLARLAWKITDVVLFRPSPIPFHGWRRFILRCFGAKVAAGAHVYPGARIWAPWNLDIGREAGVASGAILYSQALIRIGERAVVSQGAHLCAGSHDYERTGHPLITRPILVGNYAWIAAEAFLLPGACVGDGAVIGVRSLVTKPMPAWTVCVGSPCRPIKPRQWRPPPSR